MANTQYLQLLPIGSAMARGLADLVDTTGTMEFGAKLLKHLAGACGADYCAVFRVGAHKPSEIVTSSHDGSSKAHKRVENYLQRRYWVNDPAMVYAQTQLTGQDPMLMRVDVTRIKDPIIREEIWPGICDRVVIAGKNRDRTYSMSILREGRGGFSAADMDCIGTSADLLISLLAKHEDLTGSLKNDLSGAISSLPDIEARISGASKLTPREAEVCARILYGLTTTGIALDLGISNETVKTFRKLAYRRLKIGSEHELMSWYLALRNR
jgi:DNA-binding CsgD family transcriptional regulator